MKFNLDTWIAVQDALEAIGQKQSMAEFAACHKPEFRQEAERIYDYAQSLIRSYGTRRKAVNHIERNIEAARTQFFPA
jgi:hypothetical protein